MTATPQQLAEAVDTNPTLRLLGAYSRDWVLPLFATHLGTIDGSVSAEWFHERVAETIDALPSMTGDRTPAEHCKKWVEDRWLETEMDAGRLRYRLSAYSLRALQFVREIVDGETTVTTARLESIAHAVHTLADMTNPDRRVQVRRIDREISRLKKQRDDIKSGRTRLSTVEEQQQQLREILAMTRTLPADFRQLRTLVEDRHQRVARRAMADGPTKAELVEDYLHEHDLLGDTPEGRSYQGFSRLLKSKQAQSIPDDIDQILSQEFAREHMTVTERAQLETMFSTLLAAQLRVQQSYVKWTSSLRRFLTRSTHEKHRRLLALADRALSAGAEWVERHPGPAVIDSDVLGIGTIDTTDISQTQFWIDRGPQEVQVRAISPHADLPTADREALRLAAGTSPRVVARTVNRLIRERGAVTGSEVFDATPPDFRRLGALVSLLDLAITYGQVSDHIRDRVALQPAQERALHVALPHLRFDTPIMIGEHE